MLQVKLTFVSKMGCFWADLFYNNKTQQLILVQLPKSLYNGRPSFKQETKNRSFFWNYSFANNEKKVCSPDYGATTHGIMTFSVTA
jgi:hypothetical protein